MRKRNLLVAMLVAVGGGVAAGDNPPNSENWVVVGSSGPISVHLQALNATLRLSGPPASRRTDLNMSFLVFSPPMEPEALVPPGALKVERLEGLDGADLSALAARRHASAQRLVDSAPLTWGGQGASVRQIPVTVQDLPPGTKGFRKLAGTVSVELPVEFTTLDLVPGGDSKPLGEGVFASARFEAAAGAKRSLIVEVTRPGAEAWKVGEPPSPRASGAMWVTQPGVETNLIQPREAKLTPHAIRYSFGSPPAGTVEGAVVKVTWVMKSEVRDIPWEIGETRFCP